MSLYEFSYLGNHIAKKTKKETILKHETISNDDFGKIYLINNVCCIKHIKDKSKKYRNYKLINNAVRYVNKYCD